MLKEFKAFALRGNVIDLAVGVVVGSAFTAIVNSLVADMIMPVIGVTTGGINFSGLVFRVGEANIAYGKFIQATFVFIIVTFSLFLVVKAMNALRKKDDEKPPVAREATIEEKLLTEIRDLLKSEHLKG